MTRRQLKYEAQRVRELMTEDLGTSEQMAQRHEGRLHRIRVIETEMLHLQQRHRQQVRADIIHSVCTTGCRVRVLSFVLFWQVDTHTHKNA